MLFLEDSFLMLDALELVYLSKSSIIPQFCIEVGSGSGIVTSFLTSLFQYKSTLQSQDAINRYTYFLCTDINSYANEATYSTMLLNQKNKKHKEFFIEVDCIQTSILDGLLPRFEGTIDLLICNPPYIPTEEKEYIEGRLRSEDDERGIISASWAGGVNGMNITNQILDLLPRVLNIRGKFLLVSTQYNDIDHTIEKFLQKEEQTLSPYCWNISTIAKRKAGNENLSIIQFIKLQKS